MLADPRGLYGVCKNVKTVRTAELRGCITSKPSPQNWGFGGLHGLHGFNGYLAKECGVVIPFFNLPMSVVIVGVG